MNKDIRKMFDDVFDNMKWKRVILNGKITNYEISDLGFLRNINTLQIRKWQICDGYYKTNIYFDNNNYKVSAHRLVAIAFIPNPDNKPEVNHINGKKWDNDVSNLEWVTSKENTQHAIEMGLHWNYGKEGIDNPRNVYTENQINQACKMMENPNNRLIDISNITGVNRSILYKIRAGTSWSHISDKYSFPLINHNLGENNINNKYTIQQISEVCELLEDENNNPKSISQLTGVSEGMIYSIRKGSSWEYVSKNYNIPDILFSNKKYTENQIIDVCQLLSDPENRHIDISRITGVPIHTISRIENREQWNYISSEFTFPKTRLKGLQRKPYTDRIVTILSEGKSNKEATDILMSEFDLSDRRKAQLIVSDIKNRYIVSAPTTIE